MSSKSKSKKPSAQEREEMRSVRRAMAEVEAKCPPWCGWGSCEVDDAGRRLHATTIGWIKAPWQRNGDPRLRGLREVSVGVERWSSPDPLKYGPSVTHVTMVVNNRGDGIAMLPDDARKLGADLIAGADLIQAAYEYPDAVRDLVRLDLGRADARVAKRARALIDWGLRALAEVGA